MQEALIDTSLFMTVSGMAYALNSKITQGNYSYSLLSTIAKKTFFPIRIAMDIV